jgi:hypothetical protein
MGSNPPAVPFKPLEFNNYVKTRAPQVKARRRFEARLDLLTLRREVASGFPAPRLLLRFTRVFYTMAILSPPRLRNLHALALPLGAPVT